MILCSIQNKSRPPFLSLGFVLSRFMFSLEVPFKFWVFFSLKPVFIKKKVLAENKRFISPLNNRVIEQFSI